MPCPLSRYQQLAVVDDGQEFAENRSMSTENGAAREEPSRLPLAKRSQVDNIRNLWRQETHFSD